MTYKTHCEPKTPVICPVILLRFALNALPLDQLFLFRFIAIVIFFLLTRSITEHELHRTQVGEVTLVIGLVPRRVPSVHSQPSRPQDTNLTMQAKSIM